MLMVRFILIGFFSISAASLFLFQGLEITHAFMDVFRQK
jgi:hypothetical protein